MSMFERHKVLHGFPLNGQRIRFVRPVMSWFMNVIEDQKKLIIGNEYTVRKTQLNSSSSYVWLEEFPNESGDENSAPFFSLAAFEWTPPPFEPHDLIGLPGRSVLRLTDKYPIGIYINGTKACEGDPMIAITCDMKTETVTDAVWYETYLLRKSLK